jgi:hypothetical protein
MWVKVRNKAHIGTDFPDDLVEQDGKIVQWGGKGVASAIAEILRQLGAEVSEPINADEHGWELDICYKGRDPWCQVQDGDGCIFFVMEDCWGPLIGDYPQYVELIVLLNAELHRDPRFHDIRWYRRRDLNMRGQTSASPADP